MSRRLLVLLLPASALTACSDSGVKAFNNAPEAVITSHSAGDTVREGYPETFTATVTDTNHSPDELVATWTVDGDVVEGCADLVPEDDGDVFCEVDLSPGTVTVAVQVKDPQNAAGRATVDVEVVATDAPTAEIALPLAGGKYYSDQLVTFEGTVSDGEDDAADLVVAWESSLDGVLAGVADEPDGSGGLLGSATLSEGEHFLTLTVTDTSGKEARDSVTVVVGPPNSSPTCEITSPESGAAGAEGLSVTFLGLAEDVDIDNGELSVAWESDKDGALGESTPDSDGTVSFAIDTLSINTHTITLTVTDEVGARCTTSALYTVGTPPSLVVTAPTTGEVVNEGEPVDFEAAVSDGEDLPTSIAMSWVSSLDGEFSTQSADSTGAIAFSTTALSPGAHTLTVTATDTAGLYAQRTLALTINQVPTAPTVSLSPDPAYTDDALTASAIGSTDPDGSGAVTYAYAWYQDGVLSSASTSASLPASATTKGETWRVVVTPSDGTGSGPTGEAEVTVSNSAPVLTGPTPSATTAAVGDTLTCTSSATDADGDALTSTTTWTNGTSGATLATGTSYTVAASDTDPGDTVTCTVEVDDGDGGVVSGSASAIITNSAPVLSGTTVAPSTGRVGDTLTCAAAASDADGETPTLTYAWTNGTTGAGIGSGATYTIAASDTSPADVLTCTVTATDAAGATDTATATATVLNTDPVLGTVSITPSSATNDETLTCSAAATDADGGAPTLTFTWTNTTTGTALGAGASITLTSSLASSLDTLTCDVSAADADGGSDAGTASITLDNREPTIPAGVSITPSTPTVSDTLTCAAAGVDEDGDPVSLTYAWTIGGATVGPSSTLSGAFSAGDTVTCTVTPDDGKGASAGTAASASVTIDNTAPTIASVTLTPSSPQTNDTLTANGATSDADGDPVTVQWDFYVGGSLVQSGASNTLSGVSYFDKNDTVYVTATPSDGTDTGSPVTSGSVTVDNTPPTAPGVSISPTAPEEGVDDLVCTVDTPSGDDDGDAITYTAAWTVDGVAYTGATTTTVTGDTIPASVTNDGELWVCTITPDDGDDDGATASDSVSIESSADDLIVDGTTHVLSDGVYLYDEVMVINGGTLEIDGTVEIEANSFFVESGSTVDGDANGEAGGVGAVVGSGTGGGGRSTTGGGGGGGYGGAGGAGGRDSGDSPGAGGSTYGSRTTLAIREGSGGGGTDSSDGGNGGAGLAVTAADIIVDGVITMDGEAGGGGSGRNGGGGSGGGVLLIGDTVEITGTITATGGAGGSGTSSANDGGGGGGGGRIKVFYDSGLTRTGGYTVSGGAGGVYGSSSYGVAGTTGTTYEAVSTWP